MKLYLLSDDHYYHDKIIKYENRPYKNSEEMNEDMIRLNNKTVTDEDVVLRLGDFSFGGRTYIEPLMKRLKGKKYLLMGNHDKKRTVTFWKKMGFIKVFKSPIYLDKYILSHNPVSAEEIRRTKKINFHGHIHNNVHYDLFLKESEINEHYVNFCVEIINYTPFEIKDEKLKNQILNYLENKEGD